MLAKRIVACLDVFEGRVVKGVGFRSLRDAGDPAELAALYQSEGVDEVVFLDISASSEGRKTTLKAVSRTAADLFIPLTVGGGICSVSDIRAALLAGADKVSVNTAAIKDPGLVENAAGLFGSQCIVVAVDAKKTSGVPTSCFRVFSHGGNVDCGLDAVEWARTAESRGAGEILLTSIDADGTNRGYDLELVRAVRKAVSIPIIASGGAGREEHFADVLQGGGADAALAASAFHYGSMRIRDLKNYLAYKGVSVRR